MAKTRSLYPPGPENVPDELTVISGSYRLRVFLLLFILLFFFAFYFALLAGSVWMIYLGVTMPIETRGTGWSVTFKILAIVGGLLFTLFLLKGFFRRGTRARSIYVRVTEEDQPRLFAFIQLLCEETGASLPGKVYVSFEVNASAMQDISIVNMFWPARKNLHIGLGLVNHLNLTEFKAVLAHEFGHFAQKSMSIGIYTYMAHRIAQNIILGEDFFDEALDRLRHGDPSIAWLGWIVWCMTQGMSNILKGVFYCVYLIDKSLSRQMEYHADRVAASAAGSDAIVHGLKRVMFADYALQNAMNDLLFAAGHQKYTDDLFHHQTQAAERIRRQAKDPNLGNPPPLPEDPEETVDVFDPEDEENYPTMWLDHPPNYLREESVKEIYIRSEFDERSPWLLFDDLPKLRERVTFKMYRAVFRKSKNIRLTDAQEVAAMIADEHAEWTYDECYHGMYDNRVLKPGNINALAEQCKKTPWPAAQLTATQEGLYDQTVKRVAERFYQACEDMRFLRTVENDPDQEDEFEFRGRMYDMRQTKRLLDRTQKELDDCYEWLGDRDQRVFMVHYQMANQLGQRFVRDLLYRYRFHIELQSIWSQLEDQVVPIDCVLAFLSRRSGMLEEADFVAVRSILRDASKALRECMRQAEDLVLPKLTNMEEGLPLNRFLLKKPLVDNVSNYDDGISAKWLRKFLKQFDEVHRKAKMIHFKSMGSILKCQETIREKYLATGAKASPGLKAKTVGQ